MQISRGTDSTDNNFFHIYSSNISTAHQNTFAFVLSIAKIQKIAAK